MDNKSNKDKSKIAKYKQQKKQSEKNKLESELKFRMQKLKIKNSNILLNKKGSNKKNNKNLVSLLQKAREKNINIISSNPIDMIRIDAKLREQKLSFEKEIANEEIVISSSHLSTQERIKQLRSKIGNKKTPPLRSEDVQLLPIDKNTIGIAKVIARIKQKKSK